jgi:hypothetical protein
MNTYGELEVQLSKERNEKYINEFVDKFQFIHSPYDAQTKEHEIGWACSINWGLTTTKNRDNISKRFSCCVIILF